jgi:very-short-patch-repair endonuclease
LHRRTTSKIFANSYKLRRNQTEVEASLWQSLRSHRLGDIHFRRQHAIGPYVVDFCAPSLKLVIELDGSQHLDQEKHDIGRTAYLESKGYQVLRFWNHEVANQRDSVLQVILDAVEKRQKDHP